MEIRSLLGKKEQSTNPCYHYSRSYENYNIVKALCDDINHAQPLPPQAFLLRTSRIQPNSSPFLLNCMQSSNNKPFYRKKMYKASLCSHANITIHLKKRIATLKYSCLFLKSASLSTCTGNAITHRIMQ